MRTSQTAIDDFLLDEAQVADLLHCSARTVRRMRRANQLEGFVQRGGRYLCLKQSLLDQVERAAGRDPDPLWISDELADAADEDRALKALEPELERGRRGYVEMCRSRGDGE